MERLRFGLALLAFAPLAWSLDNGVSLTPPMGWMTWQRYRCNEDCSGEMAGRCINEQLIKEMADRLAEDGWRDAGYDQVSIDDCWALEERDAQGQQVADPKRFPSGMAALGDYIHRRGLKFGTYSDIGSQTCAGKVGLQGHFDQDAKTFASWGVDYIKVDGCNEKLEDMQRDYPAFGAALNRSGRAIVYSCSWPAYMPHHCEKSDGCMASLMEHCNLWRNFADVQDSWDSAKSIMEFWNRRNESDELVKAAGPGHWNDPDMLLAGNFGLSPSEEQTQFALWAIFAAPLFMSNDLREIPAETKAMLQNREVIAVNQDPLGKQGFCVFGCDGNLRVWARQLQGGDTAVVLQNLGSEGDGKDIALALSMFPWHSETQSTFTARDIFVLKDIGTYKGQMSLYVHTSSCRMLRISPRDIELHV